MTKRNRDYVITNYCLYVIHWVGVLEEPLKAYRFQRFKRTFRFLKKKKMKISMTKFWFFYRSWLFRKLVPRNFSDSRQRYAHYYYHRTAFFGEMRKLPTGIRQPVYQNFRGAIFGIFPKSLRLVYYTDEDGYTRVKRKTPIF